MSRIIIKLNGTRPVELIFNNRNLAGAAEKSCTDPSLPYSYNGNCVQCTDGAHCIGGYEWCIKNKCTVKPSPQCVF